MLKKSVLYALVFIGGIFLFGLFGCEEKEEVDLTDWSLPQREEPAPVIEESEETEAAEEETEQAEREPQTITYTVSKGETIYGIAREYGISPERLAEANGLALRGKESIIYPGQELVIPLE